MELPYVGCYTCPMPTAEDKSPRPARPPRRTARLRLIGVVVLALGVAGAGMVYWRGTRLQELNDNPYLVGFNRPERRQMEILYGKMGTLIEDLSDDLKRPGTQAAIILGFSGVAALWCFYLGRPPDHDDEAH